MRLTVAQQVLADQQAEAERDEQQRPPEPGRCIQCSDGLPAGYSEAERENEEACSAYDAQENQLTLARNDQERVAGLLRDQPELSRLKSELEETERQAAEFESEVPAGLVSMIADLRVRLSLWPAQVQMLQAKLPRLKQRVSDLETYLKDADKRVAASEKALSKFPKTVRQSFG